jgi:hypothetical protein
MWHDGNVEVIIAPIHMGTGDSNGIREVLLQVAFVMVGARVVFML